ncbi:MAG: hypothetical protein FD123_3155 [Bacteroidetes bacterium]|nr:MAG: hypothetical protein FD123_3155 [Bacteroidota bacterium]
MKQIVLFFLLFFPAVVPAQKSYLLHLTVTKIYLGEDSLVFKKPVSKFLTCINRSDTIEVGTIKGTPLAMVIDIQRVVQNKQAKYKIGYAFFKKVFGKWELIKHFGYTDRFDFVQASPDMEKKSAKKEAREEYHCQFGYPSQFEAYFKLDVYKK